MSLFYKQHREAELGSKVTCVEPNTVVGVLNVDARLLSLSELGMALGLSSMLELDFCYLSMEWKSKTFFFFLMVLYHGGVKEETSHLRSSQY